MAAPAWADCRSGGGQLGLHGNVAPGKLRADPADREHRHSNECIGGAEPERDPGEHPDLGVARLDQSVGDARAKRNRQELWIGPTR